MRTPAPAIFDLTGGNAIIQGADWTWPMRLETDTLPAPPWVANSPYLIGEYVTPTAGHETGFTYLVVVAGTSHASTEPTWPTVLGGRVTNGTVGFMAVGSRRMIDTGSDLARMEVRTAYGGSLTLLASVANGRVFMDFDPPHWVASTAYAVDDMVLSQNWNGWVYRCVDAGTSDSSAPTWPTTEGAIVTDGGVIWRNVGSDEGASNLRIQLTNAVTAALDFDGALGLYDVEHYDAFGVTTRILEGNAELRREVTT